MGRKPLAVEAKHIIDYNIELIESEALVKLATNKVFQQLNQLGTSKKLFKKIKEMALPLALKGIREQRSVEITEVLSAIRGEIVEAKQLEGAFEAIEIKKDEAIQSEAT
jgi:hypothetical protein